jgi:signal transduction histidine kinase
MRRYAINVDLKLDGNFDALPDKYRTCVYRIVQEAMTNCVRHAGAKNIHVGVSADAKQLQVTVGDDGCGLKAAQRRQGLGLRGIDERVRELQGTMTIASAANQGTIVFARVPLPIMETTLARAAG